MKVTVKNRRGEDIVVLADVSEKNKGLAFILHGMGRNKEDPCVVAVTESFKNKGYSAVRFDSTNTFGESFGKYEDCTFTGFYQDFEDVVNWAKNQKWYQEPFVAAGHIMGASCAVLFSEKYPRKIKGLAAISMIVSGKLYFEGYPAEFLENWKKTGFYEWTEEGVSKKIKWAFVEDALKYDYLEGIENLKFPVLFLAGEEDPESSVKNQELFCSHIPNNAELIVIKNAPHIIKDRVHLDEIKNIFSNWINTI